MGWLIIAMLVGVPAAAPDETAIQGRLVVEHGKPPRLVHGGGSVVVGSADASILETLRDGRISGKNLRLEGRFLQDGSFEAARLLVVRPGGETFRLVYFCEVCNITTFRPGDCMCCQAPTVPIEIPLTDPRVRQEKVTPAAPP